MKEAQQITLLFQPQDTWFFQELRPGNSLWLSSQFPPPVRAFEGAIRAMLAQACQHSNPLARSLRLAGPWPCANIDETWQRLYPWPLHVVCEAQTTENATADNKPVIRRTHLSPSQKSSRCDLGYVRLPSAKGEAANWRAPVGLCLTRADFIKLLDDPQAEVQAIKLADYFARETRLGIARVSETALSEEGKLFQTEHLRFKQNFGFALTLRVAPDPETGQIQAEKEAHLAKLREALRNGMQVRLGAEGRMAHVSLIAENAAAGKMDSTITSAKFKQAGKTQKVALIATSAMDFGGQWIPQVEYPENSGNASGSGSRNAMGYECKQNFQPDPVESGQAQSWSAIFNACGERFNLKLYSAIIGKRQVEGSSHASANIQQEIEDAQGFASAGTKKEQKINLGHGARALIPPGSVWFGELLHGDFEKLARVRLGIGKKLGRGEFALATWNEGEA